MFPLSCTKFSLIIQSFPEEYTNHSRVIFSRGLFNIWIGKESTMRILLFYLFIYFSFLLRPPLPTHSRHIFKWAHILYKSFIWMPNKRVHIKWENSTLIYCMKRFRSFPIGIKIGGKAHTHTHTQLRFVGGRKTFVILCII